MPSENDILFGSIAVTKYFAKSTQVNECLRLQAEAEARGKATPRLGEIMLEKGFLTQEQVQLVLQEQSRRRAARPLGPYQLLERLGEGGMGTVYRARHQTTQHPVALKVLADRHTADPSFLRRFEREARLGLKLKHPHLVETLEFGQDQGKYFLALELVEGGDLEERVKKAGMMPEREMLVILQAVAKALEYASAQGIIHRDIKPANILFDRSGQAKLSDFGLMKGGEEEDAGLTRPGAAVGTPHFISPEQALGVKDLDVRADLYSLGATLYYALTGRTPFQGANPYQVIAQHMLGRLTPPDEINPALSEGCVRLIEGMMTKDRKDRYANPTELLADIARVLNGELPARHPPTPAQSSILTSAKRRKTGELTQLLPGPNPNPSPNPNPNPSPSAPRTEPRQASRLPMPPPHNAAPPIDPVPAWPVRRMLTALAVLTGLVLLGVLLGLLLRARDARAARQPANPPALPDRR